LEHKLGERAGEPRPQAFGIGPLLRSRFQGTQEARQVGQYGLDGGLLGVQAGDRETCLSGVVCVRGDAMQQERSTGDRLEMFVWLGQPHEQRPPVVDEGDHPCHEPAARQILGGEAAPAPLVFQLVEVVLGIGPIAIELGECEDLVWGSR